MNEYIAFLESLIMSTTLVDKKYKDGVPACVALADINDHSADDANPAAAKAKKSKSTKKMKPGKTGLYPLEDVLIRRWWANYDDEIDHGILSTSRDEITKSRISQLRIRETQLQMIVILEVLALHPLASTLPVLGDGLPMASPSDLAGNGKEKVLKPKKPDHLIMLIDVHIDRLCIWQSIALESVKTPLVDAAPLITELSGFPKHADNILRDFCVEIIVPL